MKKNGKNDLVFRTFRQGKWGILLAIFAATFLSSCVDQSGKVGRRPSIKDFSIESPVDTNDGCLDYVSKDFTSCLKECPSGQHEATDDEIATIIDSLDKTLGLTDVEVQELKDVSADAKGVCADDIIRPNNAINVKSDHCACQNSTPITLNDCTAFCANRNTADAELLFVNVLLKPEIELNPDLGTLKNWCTQEIGDGNTNPSCVVEFYERDSGFRTEEIKNFTGSKSFNIDIKGLSYDTTYLARIVELTSGAASDYFQIRKYKQNTTTPDNSPLKIHPASMYTCITRAARSTPDGYNFIQALRLHFFFTPNDPPAPLPPLGTGQVYCHDIDGTESINDSLLFPRLELIPQHFSVWNYSDSRFRDNNANQKEDINDTLQARLATEYGIQREVKIFGVLRWPNGMSTGSGSGSSGQAPIMGYFMQPWINSATGTGFCPTQAHYNGTDPMFRVMKEVVGVDTEGIFLALREPLVLQDANGALTQAPDDVIIIREKLLKKIWFYYENGKHLVPDEFAAANKTILFYWPPDINNPYTRKSTQYIYAVRAPESIGTGTNGSTDLRASQAPPDKRFGCVPSLGEPQ